MAIGKPKDEMVMRSDGKVIAVCDLTEAEAKEIVRQFVSEQRMMHELMSQVVGGMFGYGVEIVGPEVPDGMTNTTLPANKNLH